MNQMSVLVVDPDLSFTGKLKEHKKASEYPLLTVRNGREAQVIISAREHHLAGVFISPDTENTSWLSVIKCAHFHRPSLPIYLVEKDQTWREVTDIDLKKLGVKKTVNKQISYSEMVKLVAPIAKAFDPSSALEIASRNIDEVGKTSHANDEEFVPIRAVDFISGTDSFFDIYARSPSAKYLKLVHAGEAFEPERLENYLKKGVKSFYIRREAQENYLRYCDHLATALLNKDGLSVEVKTAQTLNQGEQVMKNLKMNGVSEKNLQYAENFTKNLRSLVAQIEPEKKSIVSDFLKDISAYEHGVGTSMIAGLLANQLEIASENPFQIVGMAALFHDLSLIKMPYVCQNEDESKMSPEELVLYRQHPNLSAAALKDLGGVAAGTIQAIEQHHMKFGKTGFPHRTGTTPVGRISEIIGISDDFHRMTQRCEANQILDIILETEQQIFPCYSRVTVTAFKKVFFPKL